MGLAPAVIAVQTGLTLLFLASVLGTAAYLALLSLSVVVLVALRSR
ncbi:MAG TPA: hypothetical protein VG266_08600 [Candidatus Dormibacteraeota bacterium]|jgi:hypothetical protein|nr:hypothetical protein [Candidatus Dormibacteraeota bacterium]